MTEAEWLTATDPERMLQFLGEIDRGRKLRLFAVKCCHRVLAVTEADKWQMAGTSMMVDDLERHADGLLSIDEWDAVVTRVLHLRHDIVDRTLDAEDADFCAILTAIDNDPLPAAIWTALNANIWLANLRGRASSQEAAGSPEAIVQSDLLRDIFGNPFRPVAFDPDWRTTTAVAIAQLAYDSREFGNLPVLADALQDAGCENADILDHLRGPGPHVRGCWAVDLVLGKS